MLPSCVVWGCLLVTFQHISLRPTSVHSLLVYSMLPFKNNCTYLFMEKGAHAIVCVRSYDNLYDSALSPCESGGVWTQGIHQAWKQALFPAKPRHQPVSCFHSPFWNQALDPSGSGFPNVNCSIEQASSFYEPPPGLSRLVQFLAHLFQILIPLDPVWLKLIKLTFAKFQWLSCCWRSRFINSGGKDFRIFPCKIFHLNLLTHKL